MASTSKKTIVRVFEGFAGYGGASFAMKRLNKKSKKLRFEVVGYSVNQLLTCTMQTTNPAITKVH